jgi:hypothetical protein
VKGAVERRGAASGHLYFAEGRRQPVALRHVEEQRDAVASAAPAQVEVRAIPCTSRGRVPAQRHGDEPGPGRALRGARGAQGESAAEGLFSERKRPARLPDDDRHHVRQWRGRDIIRGARPLAGIRLISRREGVQGRARRWRSRGASTLNALGTPEVLIVGRGGGSTEDLWAFNEEPVVRAIAGSAIPVVSAVGHEKDFTLSDLVADRRAATPSNAAEIVVPDAAELRLRVNRLGLQLQRALRRVADAAQAHRGDHRHVGFKRPAISY